MCFYVKQKLDFVPYELHSAGETTVMAGVHLNVNISSCCCLLFYPWMITDKVIFACKLLLEDGKKQSCRDQISGIRYQKMMYDPVTLWHYQYSDWSTHFCRDSTSEWESVRGLSLIRRRVNSLSLSSVLETNELTAQALCPGRGQLHTMIPIAFCTPTMRNCAFSRGLKLFQRPWTRQPGLTASTRWVSCGR